MEQQTETQTCPWCHKEVKVDAGHQHLYTCPFCKNNFTFTPGAAEPEGKPPPLPSPPETPLPSDFVETPFVKDLVDRSLAYLQHGLHVHFSGPAGSGKTTLASTSPSGSAVPLSSSTVMTRWALPTS